MLPADIEHLYVSDAALGAQDTKINKVEVPALGGGWGRRVSYGPLGETALE